MSGDISSPVMMLQRIVCDVGNRSWPFFTLSLRLSVLTTSEGNWKMTAVVPGPGRKRTSLVWIYFKYDAVADKSRCIVTAVKAGGDTVECGQVITGNNATNVRAHLRTTHKAQYDELLK